MKGAQSFVAGTALGAGIMFLLDPRQSGARRARIRDKSVRAVHELEHAAQIGARDLEHRVEGAVARIRGSGHEDVTDDHVLEERVRSVLGRHCSHPHAIRVVSKGDGVIELIGPILASDLHDVLHAVRHVPGVQGIDDDLEVHETPAGVSALQGEPNRRRRRALRVTPAEKLIVGIGIGGVALSSLLGGHVLPFVGGLATVLALARSITARSGPLLRHRRSAQEGEREHQQRAGGKVEDGVGPIPDPSMSY